MSATMTFHYACDACGKRADVTVEHPNQSSAPSGWKESARYVWGIYCSEPCLRSMAVADAVEYAARTFASEAAVAE